jgi:hypothetical protein
LHGQLLWWRRKRRKRRKRQRVVLLLRLLHVDYTRFRRLNHTGHPEDTDVENYDDD